MLTSVTLWEATSLEFLSIMDITKYISICRIWDRLSSHETEHVALRVILLETDLKNISNAWYESENTNSQIIKSKKKKKWNNQMFTKSSPRDHNIEMSF